MPPVSLTSAARVTAALVLATASAPAAMAAGGVGLYVVPGIFFDESSGSSKIDAGFRPAVDIRQAVALLQQRAQAHFPDLAATIDGRNRLRTLALSAQVTRVSRYRIDKADGTTDIYLPITLSLYFTNPMTGEVLQSFSQTRYEVMTVTRAQGQAAIDARIADAYRGGFAAVLDSALAAAARQFKPYVVETRVADTWKGFVILDKGYQDGIGKGDVLNSDSAEIRVEAAGARHAVAVPVLGTPRDGATFSRASAMALSDVKKPRVMALVSDGNTDLTDVVSTQLFTDKLGSSAPFATLPLNANFSQVQASIDSNTRIGHEVSGKRALPDYFIRLVVPPARQYALPTNLAYKTQQRTQAWAFAELLSRDGRVLYAADVDQRIDDTVTDQAGFNPADRREVALKNALNDLADRFAREIRFKPLTLKVGAASAEGFQIDDPGLDLQIGDTIRVYHGVGKPGGLSEEAMVPTWDATVVSRDGARVQANPILPVAGQPPRPDSGDVILLDSVARAGGGQRVAFCPATRSQVGSVALDRFDLLAYAGAAAAANVMINPKLADLVKGKIGGQSGFGSELMLRPGSYDRCLEALYRIDAKDRKCEDGSCTQGYTARLAYRQRAGGNAAGQAILEHAFTSSGYPATASAADVDALQRIDLDLDTRKSLDDVMKQLLKSN